MNIKSILNYKGPDNTKLKADCQIRIGQFEEVGYPYQGWQYAGNTEISSPKVGNARPG
jgi:hypothetical protein